MTTQTSPENLELTHRLAEVTALVDDAFASFNSKLVDVNKVHDLMLDIRLAASGAVA
jgi:hypothetical protein